MKCFLKPELRSGFCVCAQHGRILVGESPTVSWSWRAKRSARLHLAVNETKSAVASVFGRKFLGYAFWRTRGVVKRRVADKAIKAFKARIRELTSA
ncbi:hypothetical protein RGR602_CH01357 [Rhizobium gallicum bv. gallicum R602sp]|uniref:Uncharacterized protein n=1 Tax=Rhizobium gallicum bv. gallicum R602sp TaxID=1041138 RepID=A0A0B4WYF2_9HYPH|nr:hypothetical protein RGR602_CH01357 [Rhizobium gallicum bv. gallicum R602sp]